MLAADRNKVWLRQSVFLETAGSRRPRHVMEVELVSMGLQPFEEWGKKKDVITLFCW